MKLFDKHLRINRPARHHDNRREGNQIFPGVDTSGWTLKEIREHIRGGDRRQDDRDDFAEGEADGTASDT